MAGRDQQSASGTDAEYARTAFRRAASEYGWWNLIGTWSLVVAALLAGAAALFFRQRNVSTDVVVSVAGSFIALSAALFGIVLAGLAVVAAFFDPTYLRQLHATDTLRRSLFAFWWVAALTVCALVAAVVVQFTAGSIHARCVVGTEFTIATFLFLLAIFEALSLVGTVMRHGLWRARMLFDGDDQTGAGA